MMVVHDGIARIGLRNPVVTMGSFDGLHLGHQRVIRCLLDTADELGGESVVITFEPHPREVLYPMEKKPGILTTLEEKIALLEQYGVEHLVVLNFTAELGRLEYADFVREILVEALKIKGLVVGYDHRFGKDRAGSFSRLQQLAARYHFHLKEQPVFEANDVNVSSTKIRNALAIGDVRQVNAFLGYHYTFSGRVVDGEKLGRSIGFPTANLHLPNDRKLLPAAGVYVVYGTVDHERYAGVLNIGIRPTVSSHGTLSLEVHLFDFDRDIYGQDVTVQLLDRLRGEQKFNDIRELTRQLEKDKVEALRRLAE